MSYDTYKIFTVWILNRDKEDEKVLLDIFHKYGLKCTQHPSLFYFEIVKNPTGSINGLGFLTDDEMIKITDWLIKEGGNIGETVLIENDL